MTHYPILFSRRDVVKGDGFEALVIVAGRALVIEEECEFWAEAVNPGGFAAGGDSVPSALNGLTQEYVLVLGDIAGESASFEAFEKSVALLFDDTNVPAQADWDEAVRRVRSGDVTLPGFGRRPAESRLYVEVRRIVAATPMQGAAALVEPVGDLAMAA